MDTQTNFDPQIFEVYNVHGYADSVGTVYLLIDDVAVGLGFVQVQKKVSPKSGGKSSKSGGNSSTSGGKIYTSLRLERINKYLRDCDCLGKDDPDVKSGDYIPEQWFYFLAMKANNAAAKKFQYKVAYEIMPAIRKNGYYSLTGETAPAVASAPDFASLQAQLDELKAMVAQLLKSNKYLSNIDLEKNIADAVKAGKNPNRVLGQLKRARDYIALMLNEEETFAVVKVGQSSEVESRLNKIAKKYYLRVVNHYKTVLLPRKVALAVEGELKNILDPFKLEGEFFLVDYKVAYVIITALESLAADLSKVYDPEDDNDVLKIEEKLHRKAVKLIAANNLN